MIKEIIARIKEAWYQDQYKKGFEYAMSYYYIDREDIYELNESIGNSFHPFDMGVRFAIRTIYRNEDNLS